MNKNEWYFNGTIWNNLGQFIISQATTTVAGIVKLGSNTTIGSLDGDNVITENILKTIVNTQLLRKDIDEYVKNSKWCCWRCDYSWSKYFNEWRGKLVSNYNQLLQSVYNSSSNKG